MEAVEANDKNFSINGIFKGPWTRQFNLLKKEIDSGDRESALGIVVGFEALSWGEVLEDWPWGQYALVGSGSDLGLGDRPWGSGNHGNRELTLVFRFGLALGRGV